MAGLTIHPPPQHDWGYWNEFIHHNPRNNGKDFWKEYGEMPFYKDNSEQKYVKLTNPRYNSLSNMAHPSRCIRRPTAQPPSIVQILWTTFWQLPRMGGARLQSTRQGSSLLSTATRQQVCPMRAPIPNWAAFGPAHQELTEMCSYCGGTVVVDTHWAGFRKQAGERDWNGSHIGRMGTDWHTSTTSTTWMANDCTNTRPSEGGVRIHLDLYRARLSTTSRGNCATCRCAPWNWGGQGWDATLPGGWDDATGNPQHYFGPLLEATCTDVTTHTRYVDVDEQLKRHNMDITIITMMYNRYHDADFVTDMYCTFTLESRDMMICTASWWKLEPTPTLRSSRYRLTLCYQNPWWSPEQNPRLRRTSVGDLECLAMEVLHPSKGPDRRDQAMTSPRRFGDG